MTASRREIIKGLSFAIPAATMPMSALAGDVLTRNDFKIEGLPELDESINSIFPNPIPIMHLKSNTKSVMHFSLRTTIYEETPYKIVDSANDYPRMTFVINKELINREMAKSMPTTIEQALFYQTEPTHIIGQPRDWADRAKSNLFDLLRLSNSIAKDSRRGRANMIFMPAYGMLPELATNQFTWVPNIRNVNAPYVMLYMGNSIYDCPIVGIKGLRDDGLTVYWKHDLFEKYVRFFELAPSQQKSFTI